MGHQTEKMGRIDEKNDLIHYEDPNLSDIQTHERPECWFAGTIMGVNGRNGSEGYFDRYFYRLAHRHNQITQEETGFNQRFKANNSIALRLAEFFPLKWLNEISNIFRETDPSKIGLRYEEGLIYAYLAYIDLLLIFRGETIRDSTLEEISQSLGVELKKDIIRSYRLKLLRIFPELKQKWLTIRRQTPSKVLFATVIYIMNNELVFPDCSSEIIFQIKHRALEHTKQLIQHRCIKHIKKPETWARALCLLAINDFFPSARASEVFPHISIKLAYSLSNRSWKIEQLLSTGDESKCPLK